MRCAMALPMPRLTSAPAISEREPQYSLQVKGCVWKAQPGQFKLATHKNRHGVHPHTTTTTTLIPPAPTHYSHDAGRPRAIHPADACQSVNLLQKGVRVGAHIQGLEAHLQHPGGCHRRRRRRLPKPTLFLLLLLLHE